MSALAQRVQKMCEEIRTSMRSRKTPPSIDEEKQEKKETLNAVIAEVRTEVFRLDPACICGQCKPSIVDQMHEIVPRSKTRGLPPRERFSTKICVRLSAKCHRMVTGEVKHGKRLKIEMLDKAKGANGPLLLTWKNGKTVTYRRRIEQAAL